MKNLNITVAGKIAEFCKRDGGIVCGNSDYQITFAFDNEWDDYEWKTARFIWNGGYVEVDFTGNTCIVPIINNTAEIYVGVYVKTDIGVLLATTTAAIIPCYRSILCNTAVTVREPESIEAWRDSAAQSALAAAQSAQAAAQNAQAAAQSKLYRHRVQVSALDGESSLSVVGEFYYPTSSLIDNYEKAYSTFSEYDGFDFRGKLENASGTQWITRLAFDSDELTVFIHEGAFTDDECTHFFDKSDVTISDTVTLATGSADGEGAIVPIFKVDGGEICVSYNNGDTWISLGNVQGANGFDGSCARISEVTLSKNKWLGSGSLYSQVVQIKGVKSNTQVDLKPDAKQLGEFYTKDLTFVTENNDKVVKVYCIGEPPENDYTIQVTLMEVENE